MVFRRNYEIKKGEMNLTPLVDVVLQLIIFFMLSSSLIMQPGIKIKLPAAKTTDIIKEKEIFIDIAENGTIFFNGKVVNFEELEEKFKNEIKTEKQTNVILVIKADKNTKHGIVVKVMDIGRKCGIERIAIGTIPEIEE
ncbi:MAG: biopolymer transporter ExbD [Candidatus Omnitrophica bacterium]|nr:biopolymer transporter ExbD [Candidatus Omnitrophota bacterium]MCM8807028.1 biopolymer transporter ExbD [Candidatus Omnitrophota bacterium]